jgi:transcriptional regulator NrdR family protein
MKVIKKSGKEEKFSITKLKQSVTKATKEAKVPPIEMKKIIEKTTKPIIALSKKQEKIKSKDIRKKVFDKFGKKYNSITKSWKAFEKKK